MFWKKQKNNIAIEINDSSIKLLELSMTETGLSLSASASLFLKSGIVEKGIIKDGKRLKASLKEILNMAGLKISKDKVIHFALPDNLVYTHIFREDIGGGKSIKQLVSKEFQKSIPLLLENSEFSYKVTDKHGEKEVGALSTVVIVAASKKSLLHWQNFFDDLSISIEFFDIDSLALYRGLFDEHIEDAVMIVDVKLDYTKINIYSSHGLEYDYSCPYNSKDFDEANDEVSEAFIKDIKDLLTYFVDNKSNNHNDAASLIPKKIILVGENKNLEYIYQLLNKGLDESAIEIAKIKYGDKIDSSFFLVLGLAKRAFSHVWENTDPFLPCIGHAYSLENDTHNDRIHIREILNNVKTVVFVPIIILVFIFGLWMLMGAISTSLQSDVDENKVEEVLRDRVEYSKDSKLKKEQENEQVFLRINEIGIPLNVRSGPGTTNKIIGQVNSGSEQVLIKEENGWYNIEWPNEESAWVSAGYATKID